MTKAAVIKDSITLRLAYSFRGLVHYPHDREHGCIQSDMIAENSTFGFEGSRKRDTRTGLGF